MEEGNEDQCLPPRKYVIKYPLVTLILVSYPVWQVGLNKEF